MQYRLGSANVAGCEVFVPTLGSKPTMEPWQVDAKNGSGQMMPKGFGTSEVLTSFPPGL